MKFEDLTLDNYDEHRDSLDISQQVAFIQKMHATVKNKEVMQFDWTKALEIIKKYKPTVAYAGLRGDWGVNHCLIYEKGKLVRGSCYLCSKWAIPVLKLTQDDILLTGEFDCWILEKDVMGTDLQAAQWPQNMFDKFN